MSDMASQTIGVSVVYPTIVSGEDKRKHQSSESLAVVRGTLESPVNSPHKRPVTRKMFPSDDAIMESGLAVHLHIIQYSVRSMCGFIRRILYNIWHHKKYIWA